MTITVSREHARAFDNFARARAGNPYAYGGAFTLDPKRSNDCSALVLQSGSFLVGRKKANGDPEWPGNRYGSTESFRLDHQVVYNLGFRRLPRGGVSALRFKPIMLVGLQHGGGGIYSHTSCTVFHADIPGGPIKDSARGIDWESQGAGVFYYWGARAWNDRLYHDFWYLDAKLAPVAPAVIVNEINSVAAANNWLGARLHAEERPCLDGDGKYVDYANGSVYWHPDVRAGEKVGERAVAVPAAIYEVWKRVSWEQGPLGYPIKPRALVNGGVVQAFQGGAIYRQDGTPGAVMHGAILSRYAAAGFESGWGWPLGDEQHTADGSREQRFSKGITAIWHPTGVVTVRGDQ